MHVVHKGASTQTKFWEIGEILPSFADMCGFTTE
jgi:hypothetical protein